MVSLIIAVNFNTVLHRVSIISEDLILSPYDMIRKCNTPDLSVWSFSVVFDVVSTVSSFAMDELNFIQGQLAFFHSIIVGASYYDSL